MAPRSLTAQGPQLLLPPNQALEIRSGQAPISDCPVTVTPTRIPRIDREGGAPEFRQLVVAKTCSTGASSSPSTKECWCGSRRSGSTKALLQDSLTEDRGPRVPS